MSGFDYGHPTPEFQIQVIRNELSRLSIAWQSINVSPNMKDSIMTRALTLMIREEEIKRDAQM